MLKTSHNYGFFSCCSVKLYDLINYFNVNLHYPEEVDSCQHFGLYKKENRDITFDFFEHYDNIIVEIKNEKINNSYDNFGFQFYNYKTIEYDSIIPFIKKYFTPSKKIMNIYENLLKKYNIDTDNCIGMYYRATDKITETQIDSFEKYYNKLNEVIRDNKNIQILIQTDSAQFLDYMKENCKHENIIVINENTTSNTSCGIHYEKSCHENYIDIQNLFSSFLIISKCKYIICSSGNCSVWMMFYRGNADNVFQNLNKEWL